MSPVHVLQLWVRKVMEHTKRWHKKTTIRCEKHTFNMLATMRYTGGSSLVIQKVP